jgi:hypothetical protein
LANFAVCAGCVVIGSRIGTYGSDLLAGVVIAFGVLNAWSGFSSLKPGYAGTSPTDGLTLRRLFKPQSKALLLVEADWKERKRPRDWNRSALGQLRVVHERSPEATIGHLMVFYHCLDSDDLKMAQFALEEMVANSDRPWSHIHGFRTDILLEAASFFAGYHRDAAKAREILEKVETCEKKEFPTARRALIALDYAEGRIERAERRVERELLRLSSNDDWDEVPRDWLLKVRSWNAAATSQLRG